MLVRIRYSQAFRLVPGLNWWKAANALANVSWTRSSASCGVAGHPHGGGVQLVQVGHRVALEARGPLLVRLLVGPHGLVVGRVGSRPVRGEPLTAF